MLASFINLVLRGQLDPKVANAVGYLASIMLRSLEQGRTEERGAGVAVTGGTFREVYKSMWLIEKENEMRQSFAAEMTSTT